jgi:F-type H+-transporting ATPase subunit b
MAASVATAAAAAAAEHGSGGLPQFDPQWWTGQMVWMLIIFGVMFFLFAKVFVPKVGGAMDEREDRISGDIGAARQLKEEADAQAAAAAAETAVARAAAQKLALDAKAKAHAEAAQREALEEAKLGETLAKAETQIMATRDQAMTHVRDIASDTASAIIDKLTGVVATSDELASAVSAQA